MKFLIKLTIFTILSTVSVHAHIAPKYNSICVTQKVLDMDFSGVLYHNVTCDKESFTTQKIITSFLVPFPYRWTKTSLSILNNEMKQKGMIQTAVLPQPKLISGELDEFRIFEENNSNSKYCLVFRYGYQKIGANKNKEILNAVIACQDGYDKLLTGVESAELFDHIKQLGYAKVLTAKLYQTIISIKGTRDHAVFDNVIVFKK